MKQLYILGGVVIVLIGFLFVVARLPVWLSGNDSGPTTPPPEPTQEELAAFEASLNDVAPEELFDNPEALRMNTQPIQDTGATTRATLKTNQGDVVVELFTERAPITAGNFVKLAQDGFYDGVKFHRVIKDFMIQGGDPNSKDDSAQGTWGQGGPGYQIDDEFIDGFVNAQGTLSMANAGPNTGGSQFFINTNPAGNGFLDNKHAVFGQVVSGMEVVEAIENTPTEGPDRPVTPVVIESVVVE